MTILNEHIGQVIRKQRRAKGLTQRDISNVLEISPTNFSIYEKGNAQLSDVALLKISDQIGKNLLDMYNLREIADCIKRDTEHRVKRLSASGRVAAETFRNTSLARAMHKQGKLETTIRNDLDRIDETVKNYCDETEDTDKRLNRALNALNLKGKKTLVEIAETLISIDALTSDTEQLEIDSLTFYHGFLESLVNTMNVYGGLF